MKHAIIKEHRNGKKEYYNGNSWTRDKKRAKIFINNGHEMFITFDKIKIKKYEFKWIGFWND